MQMENKLEYTDDLFVRTNKKYKEEVSVARHSVWRDIKKELLSNKIAVICLVILCVIIIASFLAPLSPYDPNVIDVTHKLEGPSSAHWFGTDDYGRDYFTRALYGGRVSLTVGFSAMIVTVILGTAIGVISGYVGGKLRYSDDAFYRYISCAPKYAFNDCIKYYVKSGSCDTDISPESVFMGIGCQNYKSGDHVLKRKRFCSCFKESGGWKYSDRSETYCSEYYGTGYCCCKSWRGKCNLNGILFELFRTGSADSAGVLGKHVTGSTVSYYGYPNAGNLSRSFDIIYSVEF